MLGEIRDPKSRAKSTHNLGKTTLAKVIDYCLCKGKHSKFFLFKNYEIFKDYIFFLELQALNGKFITIRRAVDEGTKLSFKSHNEPGKNYVELGADEWDHYEVGFDSGKQILDGLLGLTAISPWDFRIPVGYALRTQGDFTDVFQLAKNVGKHRYWKPYVAHILGLDGSVVEKGYDIEEQIDDLSQAISTLRLELGSTSVDLDQILGLIELKQKDVHRLQRSTDEFDFELQDAEINTSIVKRLDSEISGLNSKRYSLTRTQNKILNSLKSEGIQFSPDSAEKLFNEAGIHFPDQIKKEFEDLIRFNDEISKERIAYLKDEIKEVNKLLESTVSRLDELNQRRKKELQTLKEAESILKYRSLNEKLVALKNDLSSLERQRDALKAIQKKERERKKIRRKLEDQTELLSEILEASAATPDSQYSKIRSTLAEFCNRFIGHNALIKTRINNEGHLDFDAEYLDRDSHPTSEDDGKSYKQVLCAAYDLAVTKVLLEQKFLRFIFHDGLLEGLDDRIKINIIETLRETSGQGIQQILTVIDSDLPIEVSGERFAFSDSEVILRLHDEGKEGRLFKISTW